MRKSLIPLAALVGLSSFAGVAPAAPNAARRRIEVTKATRVQDLAIAKHNIEVDAKKHAKRQAKLARRMGAR